MKETHNTMENQQKLTGLNQDILSDFHYTKQTQTQFMEIQNKLPTLQSIKGESDIKSQKQSKVVESKLGNQESDGQIIDMEKIQEMISGSGLNFGTKVKSDYMHSGIENIHNLNVISNDPKNSKILNSINAQSGIYLNEDNKSINYICN